MAWEAIHAAVIGGAGGIGTELSSQLTDAGATVHRLDLATGFDTTNPQQCSDFFANHPDIDTVIYAAGIALSGKLTSPRGHVDIMKTITTNVIGLIKVARASRLSLQTHRGRFVALILSFFAGDGSRIRCLFRLHGCTDDGLRRTPPRVVPGQRDQLPARRRGHPHFSHCCAAFRHSSRPRGLQAVHATYRASHSRRSCPGYSDGRGKTAPSTTHRPRCSCGHDSRPPHSFVDAQDIMRAIRPYPDAF